MVKKERRRKGGRGTRKEREWLLIYSSNDFNSQDCAKLKPGARTNKHSNLLTR